MNSLLAPVGRALIGARISVARPWMSMSQVGNVTSTSTSNSGDAQQRRSVHVKVDPKVVKTTAGDQLEVTEHGNLREVVLNRPDKLNALSHEQVLALLRLYMRWEEDDQVGVVLMRGKGSKAFCAGGDIRKIWDQGRPGGEGGDLPKNFFFDEYRLNHVIGSMSLPHVAWLDGTTMGGGVGLSVHGSIRVATENTVFAMPETGIGFFPDVGGSWFLPRLKNNLGYFLGLTGHRLKGWDVFHAGIATHYIPSNRYDDVKSALSTVARNYDSLDLTLEGFETDLYADGVPEFSLKPYMGLIDDCFSARTMEEIVDSLKKVSASESKSAGDRKKADEWLKMIAHASPTSLKVTLAQLEQGAQSTFEECFAMEYRIAQRFMFEKQDFFTGVQAVIVDKTKGRPAWNPDTLEQVDQYKVDEYVKNPRQTRQWTPIFSSRKVISGDVESDRLSAAALDEAYFQASEQDVAEVRYLKRAYENASPSSTGSTGYKGRMAARDGQSSQQSQGGQLQQQRHGDGDNSNNRRSRFTKTSRSPSPNGGSPNQQPKHHQSPKAAGNKSAPSTSSQQPATNKTSTESSS